MFSQLEISYGTYTEDESFLSTGDPEPSSRSQNIILLAEYSKWHVKVTFSGTIPPRVPENNLNTIYVTGRNTKSKRRLDFRTIVSRIDFEHLDILHDTVTEFVLYLLPDGITDSDILRLPGNFSTISMENKFAHIARRLVYKAREDPSRVQFPLFDDMSLPAAPQVEMEKMEELALGVFLIRAVYQGAENVFIYKEIDKPFYVPRDTEVMLQEIRNLRLFRGIPTIVQLVAVAISKNPYLTTEREDFSVIRGVLLEYHQRGTLEEVLKSGRNHSTWRRWPIQIADGLCHLHAKGLTHMDLKPSNIVIDTNGNAVLIDISGIGGTTYEWLAPEVRGEQDPFALPSKARQQNDIWAYGRILSTMSSLGENVEESRMLQNLSEKATNRDPRLRMGLSDLMSRMEEWLGSNKS